MKKNLLFILFMFSIDFVAAQNNSDCGTQMKTSWIQELARKTANLQPQFSAPQTVNVPYQIHLIVRANGTSTITLQDLYDEIDSVNAFYINSGIHFYECIAPEIIYDDLLFDFDYNTEESILLTQHYSPNVINMYFANTVTSWSGAALCGYSQYPPSDDYLVMAASCATNGSTLSHELGHYFGLFHTHGGSAFELVDGSNCATEGDLICDTPADPTLSNTVVDVMCNYTGTALDMNGMPYAPDPTNIMSYSRKVCRNYFSPEQYLVMNSVSLNERSYLFCATGVDEINAGKSFVASPNPGTDNLTLRAKQNFYNAEIKLFDSIGKEILKGTFSGSSADFNTTHLTPGVYTYEIILGNNVTRGKWIKAGN